MMKNKIKFYGTDLQAVTTKREKTPEGYLKATAAITGVGVQMYLDSELGGDGNDLVGVFRGPDVVFHEETAQSARLKPITFEHPDINVDAYNYKDLSVGHVGEDVRPLDDKRLGALIQITDAETIRKIEAGLCETSAGYECYIIREDGEYEGQSYKYRFAGPMIINHLAIVERGRCGPEVRILDRSVNMDKEQLRKLLLDVLGHEQDESENNKLEVKIDVAELSDKLLPEIKKLVDAASESSEADDVDDADDDKTEDEEAVSVEDAAKARAKLISDTASLVGKETDVHGLSDREILEAALSDEAEGVAEKSDEYLRGMLDTILKDRKAASDKASEIKADASVLNVVFKPISGLDARNLKKEN